MDFVFVFRLGSLCLAFVVSASAEGQNITATVGQEVTLPCQARNDRPFEVVEWSRPEKNSEYVLVVRNKQVHSKISEQNYKGRVGLVDMENGDVSLKLSNVTDEDRGTYECYVVRRANRKRRAIQPINTVYLKVFPPPPPGNQDGNREEGGNQDGGKTDGLGVSRGHAGLVAASAAVSVIVSMVIIAVIMRKRIKPPSPPDGADEPQLI